MIRKPFFIRMHEGTLEMLAWKLEVATLHAPLFDIVKIEEIEAKIQDAKIQLAEALDAEQYEYSSTNYDIFAHGGADEDDHHVRPLLTIVK